MKKTLLFVIAMFSATSLYSQISFQEHEITSFTAGAGGNRMADIDNDGDVDIVTYGNLGVDWYENKFPEAGFMPRKTVAEIPGTNYIRSIDFTDFDGDGDLDIIGAELFQDKLFLCLNLDGQGTFAPFEVLKTIDQISYVRHIDMDNDGDKDLFYQRSGSNGEFTGYLENTNGANNYTILHPAYAMGNEISLADFDNDNLPDLFFKGSGYIGWVKNLGGGNFSDYIPITTLNNHVYHFDMGDIDNDGDLDLVGNVENNIYVTKLIYKLNDGSGNFAPEVIIRQDINDIKALRLGDVDNDSKLDLIIAIQTTNNEYFSDLQWFKNSGGNIFTDKPVIDVSLHNVYQIETSDLNNDGIRDIVISADANRTISYESTGSGSFNAAKHPAAANLQASCAVSGDVDGDGDLDVISCSFDEGKIYLYKNSDNAYQNQIIVNHNVTEAKDVALADMDGDDDLDIVCVSGPSDSGYVDRITWYENLDGLGNYGQQHNIPIGIYDSPDGLAVHDVDGDGDKDIVTSLTAWPDSGDKIVWYANNGSGVFAGEQIIATGVNGVRALKFADMDHDGDLDLISASGLDNKIVWFENLNGSGSFGPAKPITSNALSVSDFAIADFDSDGRNDIAYMTNGNVRDILWQRNLDGLGNFGPALMVNSNVSINGSSAIAAADVDNDADIDIVVGESNLTVWCENLHGQANWEPPKTISSTIFGASSLEIVDGDNDGDLDILVASRSNNKVVLFKNQGLTLNTIKGTVRLDIEGNGCAANDDPLPNILVSTTDGTNTFATLTFRNEFAGQYRLYTGEGSFETSVITDLPNYFMLTPPVQGSSFSGFGNIDTIDFCIEPIGQYNDLSVRLYPLDEARPGFDASYQLVYKNVGTTTLTGQVTLAYDNGKLQFLNSVPAATSQTASTLVFSFTDLEPLQTRNAAVKFNVFAPPVTNLDDVLVFTSTADPVTDDHTPEDNVHNLNQVVIGSYDPNDITCLEGDAVLVADADKYLHYVIRFQNSGTASAINVRVQHELDPKLDWTTLQLEGLSHNGRTTITDESLVEFTFNNIYLPHSAANEPGSHGYILFKIKPRVNTIVEGDIVHATADIFFDFNPAITTNTASTMYSSLGIDAVNASPIVLHPNPAKDRLIIDSDDQIMKVSIYNILGVGVLEAKEKSVIDVSGLESGVYLITVTTDMGSSTRKFVKE